MADNVVEVAEVQSTVNPDIQAELAAQMAISLNGGIPPEVKEPAAVVEPAVVASPADPFGLFKEKFGYETPEAAVADIESLRAFKAAPPVNEFKYENPVSEKIAKALNAGNLAEVHQILDQQLKIDRLTAGELTTEMATEVVKLGMQLKYKDLTPKEIDYKFNKQFALPPKPALLPAEDQEEFDARVTEWQAKIEDRNTELMIEAKMAKPELQTSKQKLVFPEIAQQTDDDYVEWKKAVERNQTIAAETTEAYKSFTPKTIETKINFKDEANKIAFDFQYEPDAEGFTKAVEMASDVTLFWKQFINSDGTPNRGKFLDVVYYALNKEKVLLNAMNQTKNATIKASLPDNTNGGLVRQMPQTQEPNELDKAMRESLKGYGGF
jgi:hypothetical protein